MRPSIAAALALIVLLAGCSGAFESDPATSPTVTDAPRATETPTETPTQTQTTTPTQQKTTTSPSAEEWTPPRPPNAPIEDKTEPDRISSVRIINTEPGGNGSGYSNFDVAVYANTSMQNVDPPDHGDVEGEPYFFVWIEGEPIARTGIVNQQDQKLVIIRILPSALTQFDPGPLHVEVALLDEDSTYDDQYGAWNGTVQYDPA